MEYCTLKKEFTINDNFRKCRVMKMYFISVVKI